MKRICFVTTVAYTLDTFVKDIAHYLHENGDYDITFICNYDKEFEKTLPDYITYIPVSMKRGISVTAGTSIMKLYQIFKTEKFDMVQYSTPNASLYASIAARMARIPIRLYGQWGIYYTGLKGKKRSIFKSIENIICANSTYVEPDSYGNLHYSWEENLYSPEKSGIVWKGSATGVNLDKFNLNKKQSWRKEIRHRFNINRENRVIGFVGRITKDKGIDELIEAMRSVVNTEPQTNLLLIGEIENEEKLDKELWEWAKKDPRIIFCGTTNETEKYYAAMDFLVLPSYREGFGMVVVEAEAMELPVIVTNIPGPTEAILPEETGLVVQKKNSKDLTNAILYLIKNDKLCKEMGRKGRKFVEKNFEKRTFLDKLFKKREKMLSNG